MAKTMLNDRRAHARSDGERWQTSLTEIAPNKILIRGYPVDEMMGRLGFAEAVYLLLMGELPSPAIGRMLNAVLVSSLDHGVTPPSTLAARNVATSGAPLSTSMSAGTWPPVARNTSSFVAAGPCSTSVSSSMPGDPMISFARSTSVTPGNCTRMR